MLSKTDNERLTQVSAGTPMGDLMRQYWLPMLLSEELPERDGPPLRVKMLGENLISFRDTSGKVGLIANNCPHRGASLFFGRNEEDGLRCVYHGWKFDLTGACVDMPNEPAESNFKNKVHITSYLCREAGGMIWAYLGSKDSAPPLPDLEFNLVEEPHRYVSKIQVECNWLQALEGEMDNSHAPFAHGRIGGTPDMPFMERVRIGGGIGLPNENRNPLTRYFPYDTAPRGYVQETDGGITMGWRRNTDQPNTYYWHINHWLMPSFALIGSVPGSTIQCNARVPRDDTTSWFFRIRWNAGEPLSQIELDAFKAGGGLFPQLIPGTFRPVENMENDYLIDRRAQREWSVTGIQSVTQQDRAVTETMGPIYDRTKEHLGTSDVVIIQMRRRMMRETRALMEGREPAAPNLPDAYRIRPVAVLLDPATNFLSGAMEHIKPALK